MSLDIPRKAVIYTTELLEHILGFLEPHELYGRLRVSRRFKDVITTSVSLQRIMGLRGPAEISSSGR